MTAHTWNDQASLAIARFGEATYTTRQVQDALGGYLNTSQILIALAEYGEIERLDRKGEGKRAPVIWRTLKLRAVRQIKSTRIVPPPRRTEGRELYPMSEAERQRNQCAMRLQAVLDGITRNREACHA